MTTIALSTVLLASAAAAQTASAPTPRCHSITVKSPEVSLEEPFITFTVRGYTLNELRSCNGGKRVADGRNGIDRKVRITMHPRDGGTLRVPATPNPGFVYHSTCRHNGTAEVYKGGWDVATGALPNEILLVKANRSSDQIRIGNAACAKHRGL